MSRTPIRVVRKSRGPESAAAPDASLTSLGRCVPPLSGCPLSLQPSTNLALVCRFLPARDLLSAYKVSRALSAAAASPLTFQHESEWRIDHADKGVETIGPAAVCTGEARLRAAMQSRLFRAFRILKIRADREDEIAAMLALLNLPTAPVLHVLQLEWTSVSAACASFRGFCPSLSFPFVKVLSLQAWRTIVWSQEMLHFPFPRLQVLEIAQAAFPCPLLDSLLPVLPQFASTLRHVVIRSPSSLDAAPLEAWLSVLLELESALPDLTEIHWTQKLDPRYFVDEIGQWKEDHADALPQLHKIRYVHYATFNDSFISKQLSLTGLTQLRRLTLREIRGPDDRPMMTPLTGFHRVFQSMPLLEELNLGNLAVPLSAFARAPRLRTLSMRFLAAVHDDQSKSMDQCFPSLTSLSIPSDPASRVFYTAVSHMPKLQTVQIRNLAPRPKDEFVREGLAVYAALEAESAKLESEALKTSGWVQTLGSSATAAAATAVVGASAQPFVEWHPAEPTAPTASPDLPNDFTFYGGSSSKLFSVGKVANASKMKGDKHATTAAAMATLQPSPSPAPLSFGLPPSHAAAPSAFSAFNFSSVSSALPAPSFPSVAASASSSPSPLASPSTAAPAAAFASSAFVFAPPPSPSLASSVSASSAAVDAETSSPTAVSSSSATPAPQ